MSKRPHCLWIGLALLALNAVAADVYPNKPVRMVVPFPPGSASDFLARVVSQRLTEMYNQQVVIDNRPGAGGLIGGQIVQKATPDGYTVSLIGQPHITAVLIRKDRPYDPLKDFTSVTEVATAHDSGAILMSLGGRTLRADAVPIVGLTALLTSWGEL